MVEIPRIQRAVIVMQKRDTHAQPLRPEEVDYLASRIEMGGGGGTGLGLPLQAANQVVVAVVSAVVESTSAILHLAVVAAAEGAAPWFMTPPSGGEKTPLAVLQAWGGSHCVDLGTLLQGVLGDLAEGGTTHVDLLRKLKTQLLNRASHNVISQKECDAYGKALSALHDSSKGVVAFIDYHTARRALRAAASGSPAPYGNARDSPVLPAHRHGVAKFQ